MKCAECTALIKAIDAYIAKVDNDLKDELKSAGYADADATLKRVESLEEKLSEAMDTDTKIIAEELEKAASVEDFRQDTWETYRNASALADDIQEVVADELSSFIPKLASQYLASTDKGLAVSILRQRTTDWITSWSQELGSIMKLTSHDGIQSILSNAMSGGLSVADVTRELMDSGIRTNYSRARSTALTEMLTAHSASSQEAYMQSPAVKDKEWRHSGSRRNKPRPNHVAMDGQVVPKEKPFDLTGADGKSYKPMYPRDTKLPAKERVNCHCIHSPVVSEDVLGLSLEERKALQQKAIDDDNHKWAAELDERKKGESGLEAYMKPINSLLPNANAGVAKPTKTVSYIPGDKDKANAIVQYNAPDGATWRYYYDEEGNVIMRLDNSDHGRPDAYPYGNGGAHYNRALYDKNGNFTGWSDDYCITSKMRRLNEDIIYDNPSFNMETPGNL